MSANFSNQNLRAVFSQIVRKLFLEDWTMKLVALIITTGLWLGITGLRTPTVTTLSKIPLSVRVASEAEVTNSPVTDVVIKISGDKAKINQISRESLIVSLDLSDVPPGDRQVLITPENVGIDLPAGVKLDSISPSKIPVRIEKTIERDVPVNVATDGEVASGFELYSATAVPATVRVSGPESFVKPLDSLSTEVVALEGKNADFVVKQVALNVVNPRIRLVDTTVVEANIHVGEVRIERTFILPVKTDKGERRASFKLHGPKSVLEQLKPENLRAEFARGDQSDFSLSIFVPREIGEKVEIVERKLIGGQ